MDFDTILSTRHRNMLNLSYYDSNSNITFNNITYLSKLYISGTATFSGNLTVNSNLYINNNITLNNIATNNINTLNNSNTILLTTNNITANNILINNKLYNNNDTIMYNNSTILSTLNTININANSTLTNLITSNSIVISGNIINIGLPSSRINIYTKTIGISTNDLIINNDSMLELNINIDTMQAFDNGNLSGFEILGTLGNNGFIKTNSLANAFEIKSPKNSLPERILSVDINDNLNILGTAMIYKNLTINSSLFILNTSYLNNISIYSKLYFNNDIVTFKNSTFNSTLYVNNNLLCYDTINLLNKTLIINKDSILFNTCTILSNINILNNCIINNNTTINSQVYVNNDSIFNDSTYIKNNLVGNNIYFNNNLTVSSTLNVYNCNIIDTLTINSKLYTNKIINNDTTINSNLNVLGRGALLYKNTLGTTLNTVSLLGNVILGNNILNYDSNLAAETAGVAAGAFFRTGTILRIRINSIQPTMVVLGDTSGTTTISTNIATYTELGVTATSYYNDPLTVYITYIGDILISPQIPIILGTVVTVPTSLVIGTYTITYKCTDSDGNIQYSTRSLVKLQSIYNSFIITLNGTYKWTKTGDNVGTYLPKTITWNTGINNSNIVWSYMQIYYKQHLIEIPWVNPIASTSSCLIYTPLTGATYNATGFRLHYPTAWTLSKSFFTSNISSTWYYVFKTNIPEYSYFGDTALFNINIDTNAKYWYITSGTVENSVSNIISETNSSRMSEQSLIIQLSNTSISWKSQSNSTVGNATFSYNGSLLNTTATDITLTSSTDYCSSTVNFKNSTSFNSGFFFKIYKSSDTTFGVIFYDTEENVLISFVRKNVKLIYNDIPFSMCQPINGAGPFGFQDGFLYSSSDITSFINQFPNKSTFSLLY